MKCKSCEAEINPKWKHAIQSNLCPFCGELVVDEQLRELFVSLKSTMDQIIEEFPDQLNDWMLSNYNLISTTSDKLIDYVPESARPRKQKPELRSDDPDLIQVQSEEETNGFYKRADLIKPRIDGFKSVAERNAHLKKMAEKIRTAGIDENSMLIDDDGESYVSESDPYDDKLPDIIETMANTATNKNSSSNAADSIKLLQLQQKRESSNQGFQSGNGSFSRR